MWLNDGSGSLTKQIMGVPREADDAQGQTLSATQKARCVIAGDVNGDGTLDLFICYEEGTNKLWTNDGNLPVYEGVVDSNGAVSGVAANWAPPSGPSKFTETSSSGPTSGTSKARTAAFGDANGDGRLDLFVGNNGAGNQLWMNTGSSTQPFTGSSSWTDSTNTNTNSAAFGDVDGDGGAYPPILALCPDSASVQRQRLRVARGRPRHFHRKRLWAS